MRGNIETFGVGIPKDNRQEMKVRVPLQTGLPDFPEVILNGVLDRIDFASAAPDAPVVRVVDYKTGKPKTRGQIAGTTKDTNGEYKRQLVFYRLMLQLLDEQNGEDRYARGDGVMSFLEPDGKGVYKEESFTITDEEVTELRTEIVRVVEEIVTCAFLDSECDEEVCGYCDLVEMLRGAAT